MLDCQILPLELFDEALHFFGRAVRRTASDVEITITSSRPITVVSMESSELTRLLRVSD
jgi:hypothetical protein